MDGFRSSFQGWGALLVLCFVLKSPLTSHAETSVDAEAVGTASDRAALTRLGVTSRGSLLPEIGFVGGFVESGPQGDWSFDIDRVVFPLGSSFWIGRSHPLENPGGADLDPFSAVGNSWVQNQSNALHPRVSGWIGGGATFEPRTNSRVRLAISPLFLPSFGPRLTVSETNPASGSYFSTHPPDFVLIEGVELPLRYRLQVGDIRSVVLQPQLFMSWSERTRSGQITVLGWSSPSPSPQLSSDAVIQIQDSQVLALATVTPQFERKHFAGITYDTYVPGNTWGFSLQGIKELGSRQTTVSGSAAFFPAPSLRVRLGVLHRLPGSSFAPIREIRRDDRLTTAQVVYRWKKWLVSLLAQRNWAGDESGHWFETTVGHALSKNLTVELRSSILSGSDRSFFGNWRALDQIILGAAWVW